MTNVLDNKGITIIEIILTLAILVIVLALSSGVYNTWQRHVLLSNTTKEFKSSLLKTQQLALAASENTSWGVHLDSDSYTIFKGDAYLIDDPDNEVVFLQGVNFVNYNTAFADGSGGRTSDLIFTKFYGTTYNTGTIAIIDSSDLGQTQYITIDSVGKID